MSNVQSQQRWHCVCLNDELIPKFRFSAFGFRWSVSVMRICSVNQTIYTVLCSKAIKTITCNHWIRIRWYFFDKCILWTNKRNFKNEQQFFIKWFMQFDPVLYDFLNLKHQHISQFSLSMFVNGKTQFLLELIRHGPPTFV